LDDFFCSLYLGLQEGRSLHRSHGIQKQLAKAVGSLLDKVTLYFTVFDLQGEKVQK